MTYGDNGALGERYVPSGASANTCIGGDNGTEEKLLGKIIPLSRARNKLCAALARVCVYVGGGCLKSMLSKALPASRIRVFGWDVFFR